MTAIGAGYVKAAVTPTHLARQQSEDMLPILAPAARSAAV
jgi:hypothetical protein